MASASNDMMNSGGGVYDVKDDTPCPIDARGDKMPDPEQAWELKRRKWTTAPPSPSDQSQQPRRQQKPPRDPIFAQRLAELERMLRVGRLAADEPSAAAAAAAAEQQQQQRQRERPVGPSSRTSRVADGVAIAVDGGITELADGVDLDGIKVENAGAMTAAAAVAEEDEPDGGFPIRQKGGDELRRVSESILLAFKQSRPLKAPLPLSLVTSLLYRSWELDGTIPADHPSLRPQVSGQAIKPPPVAALVASTSAPTTPAASTSGGGDTANTISPIPPPDPVKLEQMGAVPVAQQGGGGGKMEVNMLRGSRWRVEREILSGSDVI